MQQPDKHRSLRPLAGSPPTSGGDRKPRTTNNLSDTSSGDAILQTRTRQPMQLASLLSTLCPPSIRTAISDDALLATNLKHLALRSPAAARAITAATDFAPHEATFTIAPDGGLSATMGDTQRPRQLCSLIAPLREGRRWADAIPIAESAALVIRGFGCGHHIEALATRVKHLGSIFIYEPDVRLLRAVFSRVNFAPLFNCSFIVIFTDAADRSAVAAGVQGLEGTLAAGTKLVSHPPSIARLKAFDPADKFSESFADVVRGVRTTVVTTLVQADVTARNCIQNLCGYATQQGIADLAGLCAGFPAVVVSAGPSLQRTIDLLQQPGIRDRVVIIAVQTVLTTLLRKNIRPHFVTAIDYHEISSRFYEGLSAADVEGVTLIADPKCNPIIPASFPGRVRFCGESIADRIGGPALIREMGTLPPGATVAHTAYYVARHLGCDPVILIGQDLGFTDGQYYSGGAAIHNVWAGELNEFNTLEMLEWQRIARMRSMLRTATDHRGRRMYTDEQMCTYLLQFERDFARDSAAGLTIIDSSQGGVAKAHTKLMPFQASLAEFATRPLPAAFVQACNPAPAAQNAHRRARTISRLEELRIGARDIARYSSQAATLLDGMLAHRSDQASVNQRIHRVQALAQQAAASPAYWLTQFINQTGQLNRFRSDRALDLDTALSDLDRQQKQIVRDIRNVQWMGDVATYLVGLLTDGLATAQGKPPVTRDASPTAKPPAPLANPTPAPRNLTLDSADPPAAPRTAFVIPALNAAELADFVRLAARLDQAPPDAQWPRHGLLVIPDDAHLEAPAAAACNSSPHTLAWQVVRVNGAAMRARARSVATARAWSRSCWRGGIANLTCYDELYFPALYAPVLESCGLDAALLLSPRWRWVDLDLIAAIHARYLERPQSHSLTFSQAAPGLACCLVARTLIAESAAVEGPHATIGGMISYVPIAPQADPISKPVCVAVDPLLRDCPLAADPAVLGPLLTAALDTKLDARFDTAADAAHKPLTALDVVSLIAKAVGYSKADTYIVNDPLLESLTVYVDASTTPEALIHVIAARAADQTAPAVTLIGPYDCCRELSSTVRACGVKSIQLRPTPTTLSAIDTPPAPSSLHNHADFDVLSLDLDADTPATHALLTGRADFSHLRALTDSLMVEQRGTESQGGGLPARWIVPRIKRRDAVYEELEHFYNRYLIAAGVCVIDPRDDDLEIATESGQTITPLPLPPLAAWRSKHLHKSIDLRSNALAQPASHLPAIAA